MEDIGGPGITRFRLFITCLINPGEPRHMQSKVSVRGCSCIWTNRGPGPRRFGYLLFWQFVSTVGVSAIALTFVSRLGDGGGEMEEKRKPHASDGPE